MSTRSCIAIGNLREWRGVYAHCDGYPTHQGPRVWQAIQDGTYRDLIEQHPGGWSSLGEQCHCHDEYYARRDGSAAPDSPYYSAEAPVMYMTARDVDCLSIEWVYILEGRSLHVLHVHDVPGVPEDAVLIQHWQERPDFWIEQYLKADGLPLTRHMHCVYALRYVGTYCLDLPEPDWETVEAVADRQREDEEEK